MRAALPILAALVLAVPACGGGDEVEDPVASAADRVPEQGTMRWRSNDESDTGQIFVRAAGVYDFEQDRGSAQWSDSMRGETEYIIDPPVYYFRGGAGFAGFAVVPTRWAKVDAEETLSEIMTQFGRFSAAPAEYLEVVADSVRTERELGAAKIGKVDVLRYRAVVDAAKAAEHESALGEEWRKYVTRGGARTVPMEAWVDDDGVLRRIRQDAQGWTTQIDLFDFGADVEVVLPPERDVTDVTDYVPGDDD